MYIEWLHDLNQDHFKQLMRLVHKGNTVEEAMLGSYGFGVLDGWKCFVNEIKT